MPYRLVRKDAQFCVAKENGKVIDGGCHATRKAALAHMRALYSNEGNMKDTMIIVGGQVKALGKGKVGGPIVTFSGPVDTDLILDFFDAKTEFFIEDGARLPVLYEHGFDPEVKRAKLGSVVITRKPDMLWGEGEIDLTTDHGKMVYKRVENDELYWSSGAAGHMVARQPVKGKKAHWIAEWGLAEASLTDSPAEYRNEAIPLKSFIEMKSASCGCRNDDLLPPSNNSFASRLTQHLDDLTDDGQDRDSLVKSIAREALLDVVEVERIISGEIKRPTNAQLKAISRVLSLDYEMLKALADRGVPKTIKGMFEEALAEQTPNRWQLDSIYCDIIRKLAHTAQASAITGVDFDLEAKVKEATAEYLNRLQNLAIAQINEYIESGSDESFYLRTMQSPPDDWSVADTVDMDDHSSMVVSALRGLIKRFRLNNQNRIKAGRVLSEKTRKRIESFIERAKAAVADCEALLEETRPMASDAEKHAALTHHLRNRWERSKQQIGV